MVFKSQIWSIFIKYLLRKSFSIYFQRESIFLEQDITFNSRSSLTLKLSSLEQVMDCHQILLHGLGECQKGISLHNSSPYGTHRESVKFFSWRMFEIHKYRKKNLDSFSFTDSLTILKHWNGTGRVKSYILHSIKWWVCFWASLWKLTESHLCCGPLISLESSLDVDAHHMCSFQDKTHLNSLTISVELLLNGELGPLLLRLLFARKHKSCL